MGDSAGFRARGPNDGCAQPFVPSYTGSDAEAYRQIYFVGGVVALLVLAGLVYTYTSWRHDVCMVTAMPWNRRIDLMERYTDSHTRCVSDGKGGATMKTYTETHSRCLQSHHSQGTRDQPPVWAWAPEPKFFSRQYLDKYEFYYIHMVGTEGPDTLCYTAGGMSDWARYKVGDRVYATLCWGNTVWGVEPYVVEGK